MSFRTSRNWGRGVQTKIAKRVEELMRPVQGVLDGVIVQPDVVKVVAAVRPASVADNTIEIPEIVVLPTSDVTFSFNDFDLADLDTMAPQPLLRRNHRCSKCERASGCPSRETWPLCARTALKTISWFT